jgi:mono/diheme cytochrome c family protein
MKSIKFITTMVFLFLLAACGTPGRVTLQNLNNATPVKIAALPAQPTISAAEVSATEVPGTAMPTSGVRPTLAPQEQTATPFVLIYELYGTPTPKQAQPVAPTTLPKATQPAQPTTNPTQPVASSNPTQPVTTGNPTLPPTATKPSSDATTQGDPTRGKALFTASGCSGCHDVATGSVLVGPSLKGLGARAATRKPPMTGHDYIFESITKPNAYVVKGFTPGVMVQNYGQTLKDSQIEDLIAYLLTLK